MGDIAELKEIKVGVNSFKMEQERVSGELDGIKDLAEVRFNYLRTVENFVDKYIPYRIQLQISDTLHSVLRRSERKKLYDYDKEWFTDLTKEIIEDKSGLTDLK